MLLLSPVDIWQPWVNIIIIFKTQRTADNLKHKNTLSLLQEMLSSLLVLVHMLSVFWLNLVRLRQIPNYVDSRYKVTVILGYNLNIELNPQLSLASSRGFQRAIRPSNLNASVRDKHKFQLNINENSKYFSNKNWQYQYIFSIFQADFEYLPYRRLLMKNF